MAMKNGNFVPKFLLAVALLQPVIGCQTRSHNEESEVKGPFTSLLNTIALGAILLQLSVVGGGASLSVTLADGRKKKIEAEEAKAALNEHKARTANATMDTVYRNGKFVDPVLLQLMDQLEIPEKDRKEFARQYLITMRLPDNLDDKQIAAAGVTDTRLVNLYKNMQLLKKSK